jgi:hypothetical protein
VGKGLLYDSDFAPRRQWDDLQKLVKEMLAKPNEPKNQNLFGVRRVTGRKTAACEGWLA